MSQPPKLHALAHLLTALVVGAGVCAAQNAAASRPATRAAAESASTASRVLVTCDFEEPLLVKQVGEVLTAAIPVYEAEIGLRFPQRARLAMHLFGTRAAYAAAVARTGAEAPDGDEGGCTTPEDHASYAIVAQDRAHVASSGALSDWIQSLVLHEAAHQFAMAAVWYPLEGLPDWYVEGQACWLAWKAITVGRAPAAAPEFGPGGYASQLASGYPMPSLDVLLAADTGRGAKLKYPQYAAWWSLYSFLADPANGRWHRSFVQFQNELRRCEWPDALGDGREAQARVRALFRAWFPDLPALEKAWPKRPRPREWVAVELDACPAGRGFRCSGTAESTSRALQPEPFPGDAFTISGEFSVDFSVEPADAAEVVVTVARDEGAGTWLDLVVSGRGELKLCGRGDGWSTTFATGPGAPLTQAGSHAHHFEVGVHDNRITATVDAWSVTATVAPRWLTGTTRPGVGAKGATVTFRCLVLSP